MEKVHRYLFRKTVMFIIQCKGKKGEKSNLAGQYFSLYDTHSLSYTHTLSLTHTLVLIGVNFIIILLENFLYKSAAFLQLHFGFVIFCLKILVKQAHVKC